MAHHFSEDTIKTTDGCNLHTYHWQCESPKAHILLIHGYAEHAGRYQAFGKYLNHRDINLISYDLRGHGHSDGARAFITDFDLVLDDTEYVWQQYLAECKEPVFLMGHSMGGLIAINYLLKRAGNEFKGLITSGAALEIDEDISPILRKIAPLVAAVAPTLATTKLDSNLLSRDPKVVNDYNNDPLVYTGGTKAKFGAVMLKTIKETRKNLSRISLPVLIMHGDDDGLIDSDGSEYFYAQASSEDKTLKIWDDLYHEILNEPEKAEVMKTITSWIDDRV